MLILKIKVVKNDRSVLLVLSARKCYLNARSVSMLRESTKICRYLHRCDRADELNITRARKGRGRINVNQSLALTPTAVNRNANSI